ncbi:MAG: ribosome small subunit-dependent GTPase A [Bacteroidales bacterium]|nr:ribosome small subunit-dependent GTPase A [Bacteroidales bacterium]MCF8390994.1 ribosome small subunit-dependent GTPase A [Bacteroidales bacterium]
MEERKLLNLPESRNQLNTGIVIKTTGSWYTVKEDGDKPFLVECKIKGKYRVRGIRATNPVAVGDKVSFAMNDDGTGVITEIKERKNYIIRRASNLSREYQLIATNVDQAWLIVSLIQPKTHAEFIDRFLVAAEAYSIPVNIVFNKTDLCVEELKEELEIFLYMYRSIGYSCYAVSASNNEGLEEVSKKMKSKINVFSGNSGVGKSTIINKIDSNINLKTAEISSAHNTGKHTTTFAEMHELSMGGYVIDTPGIRGFGLIDFGRDELFHYFPEIFKYSQYCKFHNCLHLNEPDCGVIAAVEKGDIFDSRYYSYVSMLDDSGSKHRE